MRVCKVHLQPDRTRLIHGRPTDAIDAIHNLAADLEQGRLGRDVYLGGSEVIAVALPNYARVPRLQTAWPSIQDQMVTG
jgi:hypothetical protein